MLDIFKVRITLKACCIVYYTVVHIVLVSPYATKRHINIPMTHITEGTVQGQKIKTSPTIQEITMPWIIMRHINVPKASIPRDTVDALM